MKKAEFKITQENLKKIYGKDWNFFQEKILNNCYCGSCKGPYNAMIVDYEVYLNDLNDIILRGNCKTCGNPVNRYLETGEAPEYVAVIEKIKKLN